MTVTNPYYEFTPAFVPGTKAKSEDVNVQYQAIQTAFDFLPGADDALTTGTATFAPETGSGNAFVVTMPDTRTVNQDGDQIIFYASHGNTGASTLDVDSIGAIALRTRAGAILASGDIVDGLLYVATYDATNTRFVLDVTINQVTNIIDVVQGTSVDVPTAPGTFNANLDFQNANGVSIADFGFNTDITLALLNKVYGGDIDSVVTDDVGTPLVGATVSTPSTGLVQVILPLQNDPNFPTLAFGDGDTGFYEGADDVLRFVAGGTVHAFLFASDGISAANAAGGAFRNAAASATGTAFAPNKTDNNTGIGWAAADQLSLIAGAKEMMRLVETGVATTDQVIIGPAGIIGAAATPSLAFGDGDSGFYEDADDSISVSVGGVKSFDIISTFMIRAAGSTGAALLNEASTATNPTVLPARNDADTGIGANAADQLSLIAGALEMLRAVETGTSTSDQLIIGPAGIIGSQATPSLAFGDGDTGWYEAFDDTLNVTIGGNAQFGFSTTIFKGVTSNSPGLVNVASSTTVPNILPRSGDTDTGIGSFGADNVSLIAGGLEGVRVEDPADLAATETSLWIYDDDNGTIEQVTVGVADSGGTNFKLLRIAN